MPVLITVGRSCKRTKNYDSEGFSLSVQAELPASTIDDPNAMADATSHLFQLASDLLADQVNAELGEVPAPKATPAPATRTNGNGGARVQPNAQKPEAGRSANGGNGNGRGNGTRGITSAQVNAVQKMARKVGENPEILASNEFGVSLKDLTIKEASSLIDTLKERIQAGTTEVTA